MKNLVVILMITVLLMDYTSGQYPDCANCTEGIPLSPLSYNTLRSHMLNGTQPSNEGCTNGVSIDGQVTIDCGQGTILIDCEEGYNNNADYSNLSNYFIWNRTASVAQQVSIVFRFYQQININRISMFFWNSQSNSIIIPNVMMYWSNDDSITPFNEINITPPSPDRTGDGRRRMNIDINNDGLQFQYLRIEMTFYNNSEWIFLGEVQFCGNRAPYHITQPSTDYEQIVSSTATMANLTCSLNVTIPSSVIIVWKHNITIPIRGNETTRTGNTTTLLIENLQPSDVGIYQCVFNDAGDGSGWILRRNIRLLVTDFHNTSASSTVSVVTSTMSMVSSSTVIFASTTSSAVTLTSGTEPTVQPSSSRISLLTYSISTTTSTTILSTESSSSSSLVLVSSTANGSDIIINSAESDDGGTNVGAIVAPIVVILILLIIVIIILVIGLFVWSRKQQKLNTAHDEHYYSSIPETKLKSLTVESNTLITRFGDPLNSDSTWSTAPIYSVPKQDSKKELNTVEKTQSTLSNQSSSPPIVPDYTSKYNEVLEKSFFEKQPNGVTTEIDGDSIDDEMLDDSFDEDEGPIPLHSAKKGVSPHKSSKLPSKIPTKKSKQPSSSSTQSSLLSPLKSVGSHSSGVDDVGTKGGRTLKGIHNLMQLNPLYASSQSLSKDNNNIELNIYDSIQSPKHSDVKLTETIYSEIVEPNTLITTENLKVDSVEDAKDLYPYSSIYAEPLPLNKSESPPLVGPENLSNVKLLGTGQFGEVVLANTVGLSKFYLQLGASEDYTISIKVAVKKLKLNSTKETQQAFEKEIKFMSHLKDKNVIRLLGICTTGTPFIMMEYMENGDLNQYLQKFDLLLDPNEAPSVKEITLVTLFYMAYQIVSGMKYLSSLKYVHRDLATRNILVGKDYVVKIADFGMSQNLYSAYYFKVKGRAILPIRWMAYECFFGKFSVKTDVWAFGITLWEIFTLAKQQPYHSMSDQEVIDSALKGEGRLLMSKPKNCPDEIYEIMLRCWVHDLTKRATFTELHDTLKEISNRQ